MNLNQNFPTPDDFAAYGVVSTTDSEVVRQRLYDFQLYPTAGLNQLSFFQQAPGGGIGTAIGAAVGAAKTLADTNIELNGQIPQGKAFMVESIEVVFLAGTSAAANTFAPALPSVFAVGAAAAVLGQLNDSETLRQSGYLEFNISSKNYLREVMLGSFPAKTFNDIDSGAASTSATAGEIGIANAKWAGRPYYVEPAIVLPSGVNFDVTLKWPGLVATPSGFNARIGIILDGFYLRAAQ